MRRQTASAGRHHPYRKNVDSSTPQKDEEDTNALSRIRTAFDSFLYQADEDVANLSQSSVMSTPSVLLGRKLSQDTPMSSLKKDNSALNSKIRELQTELLVAKTKASQHELEVAELQTELKRQHAEREQAESSRELEAEQQATKMASVERQRRFLADRDEMQRAEIKDLQEEVEQLHQMYGERIRRLEGEKQEAMSRAADNSFGERSDHSSGLFAIKERNYKANIEDLQNEICLWRGKAQEITTVTKELQAKDLQCKSLERQVEELEKVVARNQQDLVVSQTEQRENSLSGADHRRLRMLERENSYLKEMSQNNSLLQEQILSLQERLERATAKAADYSRMELEYKALQEKQQSTDSFATLVGESGLSSASDLARTVAFMQQEQAVSSAECSKLKTENSQLKLEISRANSSIEELKRKAKKIEQDLKLSEEMKLRVETKLVFVKKERDGINDILVSYQDSVKKGETTFDSQKGQQSAYSESTINSMREQITNLETQLKEVTQERHELQQREMELQAIIDENDSQGAQGDTTATNLDRTMTAEEDFTDFDPRVTKVLHLKINPLQQVIAKRNQELESLREECAVLRLKSSNPAVDLSGDKTIAKEFEETKEQLTRAGVRYERLKEMFSKTVQEFREACYELTGYRMDVVQNNQYRLLSMYAEREEDVIIFQSSGSGMQLLETPFSTTLGDHMSYLQRFNSIPAFLSSVTLDLCSRQTMA